MGSLQQLTATETTTRSSVGSSKHPLLRYLLGLLLVPVLLYPTAFWLVSRPSYENWSTSKWGPSLEYPFITRQTNADVVIFGDSTAFLGIDPRVVDQQLGTKSVILPATIGSLPVTKDRSLQAYLANNKKPTVLVLYFAPWNLDFQSATKVGLFEGEEMLLRHMSRKEIVQFGLHHPSELIKFPFRFYSTFTPQAVTSLLKHVNRAQITADARGHIDYTEPIPAMTSPCTLPDQYLANVGEQSVRALVQRYGPTLHVMVYLAPIPACQNTGDVLKRSFADLGAAAPDILPPPSFAADPYYAHIRPASVRVASQLFANALGKELQHIQATR